MQISVNFNSASKHEIHHFQGILGHLLNNLPSETVLVGDHSAPTAEAPAKPRGRPAKKVEETFDLGDTAQEMEAKPKKVLTLDVVIDAFKAYVDSHSRDEAIAVLKTFKVKAVKDLKPEQYPEVLELLEA